MSFITSYQHPVSTQVLSNAAALEETTDREYCPYHHGWYLATEGETVMRNRKKIRMCHRCLDKRNIPYPKKQAVAANDAQENAPAQSAQFNG